MPRSYGREAIKHSNRPSHHELLSFEVQSSSSKSRSPYSSPSLRSRRSKTHPIGVDRERYILANFRFIVRQGASFSVDSSIDWTSIEQVLIPVSDPPICPICLECPPCLPKMTRCGHLFCWTCIFQLFDSTESSPKLERCSNRQKNWKRCPICYDDIHFRHLKSVQFYNVEVPMTGSFSTFVLLKRQQGSSEVQVSSDKQGSSFEKIQTLTNKEIMEQIIEPEQAEIRTLISEDDATRQYLELALTMNDDRIRELESFEPTNDARSQECENSTVFYFHQSIDGYPAFLDGLTVKILKQEFGEYEKFPEVIRAPVLEVEDVLVTPDFKRRNRHLAHLPLGLTFANCQLDLSSIVTPATLEAFERDLKRRQVSREKRICASEIIRSSPLSICFSEKAFMSEPNLCLDVTDTEEDFDTAFPSSLACSPPSRPFSLTQHTWSSAAALANLPLGHSDDINFPSLSKSLNNPLSNLPAASYTDATSSTTNDSSRRRVDSTKFILAGASGQNRPRL